MILPTAHTLINSPMHSSNTISNVLIFDSGVGGLSVYREIVQRLPHLNYTYLFDNEAYPYGTLPEDILLKRVTHFITNMVRELNIDLVVIACNTASTIVLPELRSRLMIPVVGVVPAIKPACLAAKQAVGLLATPATVTRPYVQQLIDSFSSKKEVALLGSSELVDMAEAKLRDIDINSGRLAEILQPFKSKVDVVVLGCTHFPLIREEIQTVLGASVTLVDSGKAIAARVANLLNEPEQSVNREKRDNQIFCSATPNDEVALKRT